MQKADPLGTAWPFCGPQADGQDVCLAVSVLGVGEDCSDPAQGVCRTPDLFCDNLSAPPSCAPRRPAGAACDDDIQCTWSMCDESPGACLEQEVVTFCDRYGGRAADTAWQPQGVQEVPND